MIKKIAKKITPCAISAVLTAGIATSPISVYADELEILKRPRRLKRLLRLLKKPKQTPFQRTKRRTSRPPHLICPNADTNEGTEKVPSEGTNLGTYEGTNSDANKVPDKVPETETGSDTK